MKMYLSSASSEVRAKVFWIKALPQPTGANRMHPNEDVKFVGARLRAQALLVFFITLLSTFPAMAGSPALPFANPFLANSVNPVTHGRGDFTEQAGPTGPSRRLRNDEITW